MNRNTLIDLPRRDGPGLDDTTLYDRLAVERGMPHDAGARPRIVAWLRTITPTETGVDLSIATLGGLHYLSDIGLGPSAETSARALASLPAWMRPDTRTTVIVPAEQIDEDVRMALGLDEDVAGAEEADRLACTCKERTVPVPDFGYSTFSFTDPDCPVCGWVDADELGCPGPHGYDLDSCECEQGRPWSRT